MLKNEILEFLKADWKQRQMSAADTNTFIAKFSNGQSVRDALKSLEIQGYISVIYADNTIAAIGLSQKLKNL